MTETAQTQDWYAGDQATLGDRLTAAREAQSMTKADLARRLGVRVKSLEAWENDTAEPRANKLQMIAGVLSVSIRWLLTGEGEGLSEPATLEADAQRILQDMQKIRQQMTELTTRMGKTEKSLRLMLKETL